MNGSHELSQREFVLIGLAPAHGRPHTPVQVQKLFFVLQTKGAASPILGGTLFDFKPHNFGPFDKDVYVQLESLECHGLVEITFDNSGLKNYRLTPEGQEKADALFNELEQQDSRSSDFVTAVSKWIRSQTFFNLLNTIYERFPDMAVNSVFRR